MGLITHLLNGLRTRQQVAVHLQLHDKMEREQKQEREALLAKRTNQILPPDDFARMLMNPYVKAKRD